MASAENLLISAIVTNGNKKELNKANFTSDNIAKFSDELFFVLASRSVPSKRAFKAKFPRFIIQPIPESDIPNLIQQCKENKVRADISKTLVDSAQKLQQGEEPQKVVTLLERDVNKIQSQFGNVTDVEVMSNLSMYINRYMDKREKAKKGDIIGVPYGIPTIDKLTGGLVPNELVTVAARTGVGKTWFMCKSAAHAVISDHSIMYLSLEMDWDAIANRLFTLISYQLAMEKMNAKSRTMKKKSRDKFLEENILENSGLTLGTISEKKFAKILKEIRSRIKGNLHVPDIKGNFGISSSARRIENLEPEIVYFDYFGLTQNTGGGKGVENWVQASEASKTAKKIARTYEVPFVMGAQLNRSGAQSDTPKLEHISLTDSIGQDSDKVFMLKETGRRKRIQVICEKFRGSFDKWRVNIDFDVNVGRMEELGTVGVKDGDDDEDDDF